MNKDGTPSSPDILFDVPSTSSPDISFSNIHAETAKVDTITTEKGNNDSPEDQSKELEGLRTVNITPTAEEADRNIRDTHTSSPPLVFKSVPTTPVASAFPANEGESISQSHDGTNGVDHSIQQHLEDEDDPRELVITSLRTQISDLFSQVAMLNSKLVQSYDRVSNLEETLDENTEKLHALDGERMNLEREKSVLELEKERHEEMLRTGKIVERSAIAAELSRFVEISYGEVQTDKTIASWKNPWNPQMHARLRKRSMLRLNLNYPIYRPTSSAPRMTWSQRNEKHAQLSRMPSPPPQLNVDDSKEL